MVFLLELCFLWPKDDHTHQVIDVSAIDHYINLMVNLLAIRNRAVVIKRCTTPVLLKS